MKTPLHLLQQARHAAFAAALFISTLPLAAQVLPELNYQGRVAVNGTAFTGTGQFRFALVADNGSVVWSSHATDTTGIAVQNGLYSVRLGNTALPNMAAVPSALFIEPGLRLRVWFNDGVNGLQQLAPDQFVTPVGYAHRAASAATADFIPASAIDGDSIQPSHMAHTLQSGVAGNLASIPAAGGVVNVTFPQAFETPPTVSIDGLTLPSTSVTGTGFTLTMPPRDLLVDDGTPATSNTGLARDAMLVGGFPAIAYTDSASGDVKFVRATNAQGSAWGAPIVAAAVPGTDAARHLSLAIVQGNPAIAYWTSNPSTAVRSVNYVRATNANGTAWGAPVTAVVTNSATVARCVLKTATISTGVVRPFIAYNLNDGSGTAGVHYVRGNDTDGTTWGAQQTPDPALNGGAVTPAFDLELNAGGILFIYSDPAGSYLKSISSVSLAANTWGTPRILGTDRQALDVDLFPTGGGLSVCWREGDLVYASEVPAAPFTVTRNVVCKSFQAPAVVTGDVPEVLFIQGTGLASVRAADDSGNTWQTSRAVQAQTDASDARPAGVRLADGTVLAVFHSDLSDGQVRVSGTNTPFANEWQAALPAPVVASAVADGSITKQSLAPDFFGIRLRTDGPGSFATGDSASAIGITSLAAGFHTTASGDYSTAIGASTRATGGTSTAMGAATRATGGTSTAIGGFTTASGGFSTAMGFSTIASGNQSTAMGWLTEASGTTSTAMGYDSTASGESSTAMGHSNLASGFSSTAMGQLTTASGSGATAMGNGTIASGVRATAMGYASTASGETSTAMGNGSTASGMFSTAIGEFSLAETYGEMSLGMFPVANTGNQTARVATDVLFEIGNGTSTTSSNALTMFKNGRVGLDNADTLAEVTHLLTLPNLASATSGQGRANAWTVYSDSRIKTEQRPLAYGLREIMRLQPRAYTQHSGCMQDGAFQCEDEDGGSAETIGFIAQEVEQVIPEAVQKPEDPANELYGMDYEKLIPVLVKAAQELKTENDTLKAQNERLQARLQAMDARLQKLERPAHKR